MGRMDSPPFARGETYANGNSEILNAATGPFGLGGVNLEGKEFIFEPNSQDDELTGQYNVLGPDPSGRAVHVKVVRNVSGQNLKPGRIARISAASTNPGPFGTAVDGYTVVPGDTPAGVVDEYLPAAGVPNNDLFYIVVSGPTQIIQGATTASTLVIGSRIVPAAYGATAGDDLGGRAALQDLTGATATLAHQLQNEIGFACSANSTAGSMVPILATRRW